MNLGVFTCIYHISRCKISSINSMSWGNIILCCREYHIYFWMFKKWHRDLDWPGVIEDLYIMIYPNTVFSNMFFLWHPDENTIFYTKNTAKPPPRLPRTSPHRKHIHRPSCNAPWKLWPRWMRKKPLRMSFIGGGKRTMGVVTHITGGCNPYKWPYKWVTGVITHITGGVITHLGPDSYHL